MTHHKRGRPKNRRAGCLMCKPHKTTWGNKRELSKRGFGNLRRLEHSDQDMKEREDE